MPAGRPRKFDSPEEMEEGILSYFQKCASRTVNEYIHPEPYTILGLCQHLGITRQTFFDYENRSEFSDTVKRAKEKVALDLTLRSIENKDQVVGCLFQLKCNHGHVETKAIDLKSSDGSMSPTKIIIAAEPEHDGSDGQDS
jgi:hypothetical protein